MKVLLWLLYVGAVLAISTSCSDDSVEIDGCGELKYIDGGCVFRDGGSDG